MSTQYISPAQWMGRVQAARSLGDTDRCLDILVGGLVQYGERGEYQLFAGEVYSSLGLYCEALQCYDAAARWSDPLHFGESGTVSGSGSFPASALGLDRPLAVEALLCGSALLAGLGFYEAARTRFDAVKAVDQGDSTAGNERSASASASASARAGLALELVRWAEQARMTEDGGFVREALEKSISICDTAAARLALARNWLAGGAPELAMEHLEAGRKLEPANAEIQNLAARCYLALGNPKDAQEAILRSQMLGDNSIAGALLRQQSAGVVRIATEDQ
jgi:tetratricopeptide (TPR) repeat protein